MVLEHRGKHPTIHDSAYIAPTAVVCGDVTIGEHSRVLFGAVIVAEGGPVAIGSYCIIMENAVVRGTPRHPTRLGNHILVGPHAHLTGCTVDDNAFLATGTAIFNGARIGARAEVRSGCVTSCRFRDSSPTGSRISWPTRARQSHVSLCAAKCSMKCCHFLRR